VLARGMPVVAGVNIAAGTPTHFVLITRLTGGAVTIVDPRFPHSTLDEYWGDFRPRGFVERILSRPARGTWQL
jgi:hypothetical protein